MQISNTDEPECCSMQQDGLESNSVIQAPVATQCSKTAPEVNQEGKRTAPLASQCSKSAINHLKRIRRKQEQKLNCPHCHLCVLKKNLKKHKQRAHSGVDHDVTAQSHLQSQCIDPNNRVFAVAKSSKGPCIPIHAIKKSWGSSHKVICELEVCNGVMDFKRRSGMRSCQCTHLKSVEYCRSDSEHVLHEEVLGEMVQQKWFSEERKKECLSI